MQEDPGPEATSGVPRSAGPTDDPSPSPTPSPWHGAGDGPAPLLPPPPLPPSWRPPGAWRPPAPPNRPAVLTFSRISHACSSPKALNRGNTRHLGLLPLIDHPRNPGMKRIHLLIAGAVLAALLVAFLVTRHDGGRSQAERINDYCTDQSQEIVFSTGAGGDDEAERQKVVDDCLDEFAQMSKAEREQLLDSVEPDD
jgi:hypothetical protein